MIVAKYYVLFVGLLSIMSAQATQLYEEDVNTLHLIELIKKSTEVLRWKFHTYYPTDETQLYHEISKHKQKLKSLMKKNVIYRRQYDILLPATEKTDSSKFDISPY